MSVSGLSSGRVDGASLAPVGEVAAPVTGWELMYAGGAHAPVNGRRLDVESAIDGTVIASIPNADADDLERAMVAARRAAKNWARLAPVDRACVVDTFVRRLAAENE